MANLDLTKKPFENCYHYDKCNKNKCSLHPDYLHLKDYSCDLKLPGLKKCKCTKPRRLRIGKAFGLSNLGLTSRELAGRKNWDNLSVEEKERRKQILKEKSPFLKLSEKRGSHTKEKDYRAKFTRGIDVKMAQNKNEEEEEGDKNGN